MKCRAAQYMISLKLDNELTPRQSRLLEEHLNACEECRSYQSLIIGVSSALKADSDSISGNGFDSASFQTRLHNSLIEEQSESCSIFSEWIAGLSQRIITYERSAAINPLRGVFAASSLAVLAGVLFLYLSFTPPLVPGKDFGNGHIAAFTTRTDEDGRAYADLRVHVSESRGFSKEKLQ